VRIRWICENRLNLWKLAGFVIRDSKQIFLSPDSWSTIRYESIVRHGSNLFGVRICGHVTVQIHGYMIPCYNSHKFSQSCFDEVIFNVLKWLNQTFEVWIALLTKRSISNFGVLSFDVPTPSAQCSWTVSSATN
jgi:hypothetical protein